MTRILEITILALIVALVLALPPHVWTDVHDALRARPQSIPASHQ